MADERGGLFKRLKVMRRHLVSSEDKTMRELIHGLVGRFRFRASSGSRGQAIRHLGTFRANTPLSLVATFCRHCFCWSTLMAQRLYRRTRRHLSSRSSCLSDTAGPRGTAQSFAPASIAQSCFRSKLHSKSTPEVRLSKMLHGAAPAGPCRLAMRCDCARLGGGDGHECRISKQLQPAQ